MSQRHPSLEPRVRRPRHRVPAGKTAALSLRDQEKVPRFTPSPQSLILTSRNNKYIDSQNFNIKLRVHFLEERAQLAPDQIDAALKQNINLKMEVQQLGLEIKKLKRLVLELEHELERLQRGSTRERNVESRVQERNSDLVAQLQE